MGCEFAGHGSYLLARIIQIRPSCLRQAGWTKECRVSASIGIAVFPDDGDSGVLLLKRADHAMCAAKREGKNAFRFFF